MKWFRAIWLFALLAVPSLPVLTHGGDSTLSKTGAGRHWAYQPVADPAPPTVRLRRWPRNDLDRFLLAKLEGAGLTPAWPADKRALLRRAAFDLAGLPPTPEETERFLRDAAPGAFERLVERLLASPRHGERWGRHWLDVVRYADTAGDNSDYPIPQARLYRDYVLAAFNDDKPYDQFLREQIAGDLLPADSQEEINEQTIATGFLALSRRFGNTGGEPHLIVEDTLETMSRALIGLSLSCARCHDHKHDPLTMEDYYGLYGIFASTQYPHPGSETRKRQEDFVPLLPAAEYEARMKAHLDRHETARAGVARLEKQITVLAKEGLSTEKLLAELADARERLDELSVLPAEIPTAYAVSENSPTNAPIQRRGDPLQPGPVIARGLPAIFGGQKLPPDSDESGRLELADWLASPANPLTARVMVNRLWQHHFGRGLVATPSDFGAHGQPPTHPELLDWLASRFIESGWSVKAMHRLIMGSAAYQQASREKAGESVISKSVNSAPVTANGVRPDSLVADLLMTDYFSPFPRRRLEAEELRDALLAVSGKLDLTPGGAHPFPPERTWDFTQHEQFNAVYDTRRRSVFLMQQRLKSHPFLALFDGADPNVSTAERGVTTTPLQSLFALNDPFAHEQAAEFARRLLREAGTDRARVERAFQVAFARRPRAEEFGEALAYLARVTASSAWRDKPPDERALRAWSSYARALLGSNEFLFVD